MNYHVFKITAKTNLHVGDEGGTQFTVIDKTVQRDPLTKLPCINSSSLKGAINEYCTNKVQMASDVRIKLFGSDKNNRKDFSKGEALFFDAKLLSLPKQADNEKGFVNVSCTVVLNQMKEQVGWISGSELNWSDNSIQCIPFKELTDLCSDENLPIIARNVLDDGGISKNLWYEQVCPSETAFYTVIGEPDQNLVNALDGKIVQIGAHATIGYGYCLFTKIG